ncbi:hypothetical protein AAG906_010224 [Vitis piasezkii]
MDQSAQTSPFQIYSSSAYPFLAPTCEIFSRLKNGSFFTSSGSSVSTPVQIAQNERPMNTGARKLHGKFPSLTDTRVPRRLFLQFMGYNHLLSYACPKLANGVRFQDVVEGDGPEAQEGDLVEVNYVCRRSNGYFVHSTVDQFSGVSMPVVLPLDENQVN